MPFSLSSYLYRGYLHSDSICCRCAEPRRAAVAIVLRIVPPPDFSLPSISPEPPGLTEFFQLDWVNAPKSRAEILFIHRRKGDGSETNRFSKEAHVAFPGGRVEEGDEGGHYTGKLMAFFCHNAQFIQLFFYPFDSYETNLGRNWP